MLEFIKNWTVNIVTLVLFIVMIEMLLPKGRIKKYVNLLTGTILIIAIIEPFTGFFGRSFDFSAYQTAAAGTMDRKEIEKAGRLLEEEQVKQTIGIYRNRIIEQIERQAKEVEGVRGARADVIINEDHQSVTFGEIKRIYIEAEAEGYTGDGTTGEGAGTGGEVPAVGLPSSDPDSSSLVDISTPGVERVERVSIGNRDSNKVDTPVIDARLAASLTERIEEVFGVNRENIIISHIQR